MREQDKMTMEQAEVKMSCLREVFPFVRLVKGSVLKDREREPAEGLPRACQCYEFWKKDKPCENCISRDVLDSQGEESKIEFIDDQMYQVFSRYVEIDGEPYVMEMIKELDERTLLDSEGYEKLLSHLTVYNEKLYKDALTGAYNRRFYEDEVKDMNGPLRSPRWTCSARTTPPRPARTPAPWDRPSTRGACPSSARILVSPGPTPSPST